MIETTPSMGQVIVMRDDHPFSGMAIAGFICSLLWIFGVGSIAAIIMSAVAMQQRGKDGRGLAVAGLIIGILGLLTAMLIVGIGLLGTSQQQLYQDTITQLGQ